MGDPKFSIYQPVSKAALELVPSLLDMMSGGLDLGQATDWQHANPDGAILLKDAILGTILWREDLGRPATPSLHDAFTVDHKWCLTTYSVPDPKPVERWLDGFPATLFDLPTKDGELQVGFQSQWSGIGENWFAVAFGPGVTWRLPPGVRRAPTHVVPGNVLLTTFSGIAVHDFTLSSL